VTDLQYFQDALPRETARSSHDEESPSLRLDYVDPHHTVTSLERVRSSGPRRSRDTRPELLIRKALFHLGLRYRVNFPVPGSRRRSMDIAFPRWQVAIFVDGCYWHGCPMHFKLPKTNTDFWVRQISRTRDRDSETNAWLRESGWTVMRFWEHQDSSDAAAAIFAAVT